MISESRFTSILKHYSLPEDSYTIETLGNGLINDTFLLQGKKHTHVLQRVNTRVFTNIDAIENNLSLAKKYLSESVQNTIILPIATRKNTLHVCIDSNFYRILPFADNGEVFDRPPDNTYLFSAAHALGKLAQDLKDIPFTQCKYTIADFHNLEKRYRDYKTSKRTSKRCASGEAKSVMHQINRYRWLVKKYQHFARALPVQLFHHDTKINNIMFCKGSSEVRAIIDFDTLMPGYIMSDIGDLIRGYMAYGDSPKYSTSDIVFSGAEYEETLKHYIQGFGGKEHISDTEYSAIVYGAPIIAYMLALRFMTDYLNGDIYFRTSYESENIDRAKKQMRIVQLITDYLDNKKSES